MNHAPTIYLDAVKFNGCNGVIPATDSQPEIPLCVCSNGVIIAFKVPFRAIYEIARGAGIYAQQSTPPAPAVFSEGVKNINLACVNPLFFNRKDKSEILMPAVTIQAEDYGQCSSLMFKKENGEIRTVVPHQLSRKNYWMQFLSLMTGRKIYAAIELKSKMIPPFGIFIGHTGNFAYTNEHRHGSNAAWLHPWTGLPKKSAPPN